MAKENVNDVWMASIPMDALDELTAKLEILSANLHMIHGTGFDNFIQYSDKIQQSYLWGCAKLADECKLLASSGSGAAE